MEKIAIAGIGAIGSIVGGRLAASGRDVLLIEPSWREHAETMKRDGLVLTDSSGEQRIKVDVMMVDELPGLKQKIDVLFITVKSNDTLSVLNLVLPHLSDNSVVMSLQNGINEDIIIPVVGRERTAAGVCYTGGRVLKPGYASVHEGYFVIGELDGRRTGRIEKLAQVLGAVKRTEISSNIMAERWSKLAQVTMSVPVACITGLYLGEVFHNLEAHRLMAGAMHETLAVAAAAGYPLEGIIGISFADLGRLARGPASDISRLLEAAGDHFPPGAIDAMTGDIRNGLKLEIDYTNGHVVSRGKELGVPTPANEFILEGVKSIEAGKMKPGLNNLALYQ
jgi:2-dehydropantoate 2-reductase